MVTKKPFGLTHAFAAFHLVAIWGIVCTQVLPRAKDPSEAAIVILALCVITIPFVSLMIAQVVSAKADHHARRMRDYENPEALEHREAHDLERAYYRRMWIVATTFSLVSLAVLVAYYFLFIP